MQYSEEATSTFGEIFPHFAEIRQHSDYCVKEVKFFKW